MTKIRIIRILSYEGEEGPLRLALEKALLKREGDKYATATYTISEILRIETLPKREEVV